MSVLIVYPLNNLKTHYEFASKFAKTTLKTTTSLGCETVFCNISLHKPNPVKYTDPDGKWIDNGDGTFIAEKGDTLWGLQQDTGRDWKTSDYSGKPELLQIGQKVSFATKNEHNSNLTVDSTSEAVSHYLNGDGSPVNIGTDTINTLQTHPEQLMRENRIRSGQTESLDGNYGVDITWSKGTYYVGNTRVEYSTTYGRKFAVTNFTAFAQDGFWDIFAPTNGDRQGSKGEILGGKPYPFIPHQWSISYPNPYK
jgi:hypothetical protein